MLVITDKKTKKVRAKIYYQSVFKKWAIEDNFVQAVMTSPPYWQLRKYDIPNIEINGWKGQYGLEELFEQYIEHTLLWCKEVWRVLKNNGIFFLNIGDSYSMSGKAGQGEYKNRHTAFGKSFCNNAKHIPLPTRVKNKPPKCKLMIPERIAINLIENQGWILRNHIIWYSPNKMPESCNDRYSKKWESIFMFVKQPIYYFNLDAVKIESKTYKYDKRCQTNESIQYNGKPEDTSIFIKSNKYKNPGDMWDIPTQPLKKNYYAGWPEQLCKKMLLCSTKENDIILDPFTGSGRTIKVALELNRRAIGIDLGYNEVQKNVLKDFIGAENKSY